MRVVVTGGAGFIGANLCSHLIARELADEVLALDDLSTGYASNLADSGAELVEGSILDEALLGEVFAGADAVVHLAARPSVPRSIEDPAASHEVNATGTLRVLQAAREARGPQVVVASSSSVYGANPELPKNEAMVAMPMSPYAVSKLAAEQYALAWAQCYGLATLALRFFNVFGPLQAPGHAYAAVVPSFVSAALADEPLTVHGDGKQSRDFTYVGTVCAVIADVLARGVVCDRPVNLAFGTRTNLLEVIELLESELGHSLERNHVEPRPGDVRHSQADNTLLRSLVPGVEPIDLRTGVASTIQWMNGVSGSLGASR